MLQIVQTRILSVMAWYYLAFFAISVAMLGMTAGAVWVHLGRARLASRALPEVVTEATRLAAVSIPVSLLVQFSLVTTLTPTLNAVAAWALLMAAMTMPYVFAGVAISLALTRSPFPVPVVYGVDLLGAALGCAAVVLVLDVMDGPAALLLAGFVAGLAAWAFAWSARPRGDRRSDSRSWWRRPAWTAVLLGILALLAAVRPGWLRPILVKDALETDVRGRLERWNSYSRVVAYPPYESVPNLWGPSPAMPSDLRTHQAVLNIDGAAGTLMHPFDGTAASLAFLTFDLVNLAYYLPGLERGAVIGVGGGRDLLAAHAFGVREKTGVELNPIFVDLLTKDPVYAPYANLQAMPGLRLIVDDARSWFASSAETFDIVQMSLIDTWAATGAGAFSLSENGLYTLEGWRAFVDRLTPGGVFTVSRWHNPGDVNESGRMIALALATLMDAGVAEPRRHVFVARVAGIATLILARSPFSADRLAVLRNESARLGFEVLVDPDHQPASPVLRAMVDAPDRRALDAVGAAAPLDLTVPTDSRPFFFNQLRFGDIPAAVGQLRERRLLDGVVRGNLTASITLVLILGIAAAAVVCTIVLPLRRVARQGPPALVAAGTAYFALIGMGFMLAEIALLQYFGVFLGHPVYAMGVCLFAVIASTGVGSLLAGRLPLRTRARVVVWAMLVGGSLIGVQALIPGVFAATTAAPLPTRIAVCLALVTPIGVAMGFGFPTGMALVARVDDGPTPWFWGINGAVGVLASVLAVMIGISYGIDASLVIAGLCYLLLVAPAVALLRLGDAQAR